MEDASIADFYDEVAGHYHLIFDDWEASIHRQASIISALLPAPEEVGKILDCACGIGTQALALSLSGYEVDGCDISSESIARAKVEAKNRNLGIRFWVDDMREITGGGQSKYGCILCMDNAIPHLHSDEEILTALSAMSGRLKEGGSILLSIRDYDDILRERPSFSSPKTISTQHGKRIVFQMWEWLDGRKYDVHLHINELKGNFWSSFHSVGQYRAITASELGGLVAKAGFSNIEILSADVTGFYQPIIRAQIGHRL